MARLCVLWRATIILSGSKSRAGWLSGGGWRGSIPYLFEFYISAGLSQSGFSAWLSRFRGEARPTDDLADYAKEFFGVQVADISADADRADTAMHRAIKEIWTKIHEDRRSRLAYDIDPMVVLRLAEHDTENFVGVMVRRQQENASAFGYTSWWLTLDHMAFQISQRIKDYTGLAGSPSPVMSADFLANYLAFGPLRGKVARADVGRLPLAMDVRLVDSLTTDLVDLASKVRRESEGLPEYVIQRKVRDALDQARRRTGKITQQGLEVQSTDLEL